MNRRSLLASVAGGGVLSTAGCAESLPFGSDDLDAADVFEGYRYEGTDLVVTFREDVDVGTAVLYDPSREAEYETIDRPAGTVRFQVIFPNRLATYVSRSLRVRVESADGEARQSVGGVVHGVTREVTPLEDGRGRLTVENQGDVPLLVHLVAIHGDVPNPTIDPQAESVDRSSFDLGPGVIGSGPNRPLTTTRTDLVVSGGETKPFETTYAPFAFPNRAGSAVCDGDERNATATVVHASGGSTAFSFSYRLEGAPAPVDGTQATVCRNAAADGEDG